MKTKTSILAALMVIAGSATLSAQVYSVNVVGYVNVTNAPNKYNMIANQLNTTNNTIGALIPTPPAGTQILKWTGAGYSQYDYLDGFGWFPDGDATLNPGEGAFIKNNEGTNFVVTFVGEVLTGTQTNSVPGGVGLTAFAMRSVIVPQAGTLEAGTNAPALNFPAVPGDAVLKWTGTGYSQYDYIDGFGWFPEAPPIAVGEAFFSKKASSVDWVRTYQSN